MFFIHKHTQHNPGIAQQTIYVVPMLFKYRATVCYTGPLLKQHWVNVSCLLTSNLVSELHKNAYLWVYLYRPARMAHSVRLWLETRRYWARIPVGSDGCYRGCAYTVLRTVQKTGVCSALYGAVYYQAWYYKEPFKSYDKCPRHSPDLGFFLSRYCHDRAESDVKQYSLTVYFSRYCVSVN